MDNECSFPDCDRAREARGLCATHYAQKIHGKELTPIRPYGGVRVKAVCAFEPCGRTARVMGLCASHYSQKSRGKGLTLIRPRSNARTETVCAFEPCGRIAETKGWCHSHYAQQHRGRPLSVIIPPLSTEGTCEIDGCEFRIASRRLCSAHYQRARRLARREAAREGK